MSKPTDFFALAVEITRPVTQQELDYLNAGEPPFFQESTKGVTLPTASPSDIAAEISLLKETNLCPNKNPIQNSR